MAKLTSDFSSLPCLLLAACTSVICQLKQPSESSFSTCRLRSPAIPDTSSGTWLKWQAHWLCLACIQTKGRLLRLSFARLERTSDALHGEQFWVRHGSADAARCTHPQCPPHAPCCHAKAECPSVLQDHRRTLDALYGEPYLGLPCRGSAKAARLHTSPMPSTCSVLSRTKATMAGAQRGRDHQSTKGVSRMLASSSRKSSACNQALCQQRLICLHLTWTQPAAEAACSPPSSALLRAPVDHEKTRYLHTFGKARVFVPAFPACPLSLLEKAGRAHLTWPEHSLQQASMDQSAP